MDKEIRENRIFAIPDIKKAKKYCFDKCGKVLVGHLSIEDFKSFACDEEKCPYEEKRIKYGKSASGIIYLRKLTKKTLKAN